MKVQIIFELAPAGIFGVPEEGVTVIPGRPGSGDIYDIRTGMRVGYGELSEYRMPNEALRASLVLTHCVGTIIDNFVTLHLDTQEPARAASIAAADLDEFLRHLTLNRGLSITYRILFDRDRRESATAYTASCAISTSDGL